MDVVRTTEREITEPVDLCGPDGRLNPAAVGWTRTPLHRAPLGRPGQGLRRWGRTKRWEYWAVQAPTHVLAVTVSSLDYAGLVRAWVLDPQGRETSVARVVPLAGGVHLGDRAGQPARARVPGLAVDIDPGPDGTTRLRVRADPPTAIEADVVVTTPLGHEAMGVVVPWSRRLFQYTVKDNTRPAAGRVALADQDLAFDPETAWATLDHGRGRWPYRITWNWGSGSGRLADGRSVGIQLGGRWTDGTGSTENALCLDGRLSKIGSDLWWEYDTSDWVRPWRVRDVVGDRLDLTLTPTHVRADRTELALVGGRTHQCFGSWHGWMVADDGERVEVAGVLGWAEEARQRW